MTAQDADKKPSAEAEAVPKNEITNPIQEAKADGNNEEKKEEKPGRGRRRVSRKNPEAKGRYTPCPLCGNLVRDLYTAIAYGQDHLPCHFDCVLKALSDQEELSPGEKVVYLGKGSFGVVWISNSGKTFEIKRKIDVEDQEIPLEWRKSLARKSIITGQQKKKSRRGKGSGRRNSGSYAGKKTDK